MADSDLYNQHREVIQYAIAFVCRRHRLASSDAEDFASVANIHLLNNDAAVLRAFGGRSSIQTYLIAVIGHQFQDWRNAHWGKWRPSAEARRQGPLAVLLETRLVRDQLSMDEAVEMLRTNHGVTEPRSVLEEIARRFPSRPNRIFVGDEALEGRASPTGRADGGLAAVRAGQAARHAADALETALAALAPRDRMILRMRFDDDVRVADIARLLSLDQKGLYRRIDRLLSDLRVALEGAGIGADEARDVLEHRGFDFVNQAEAEGEAEVRPFDRRGTVTTTGDRWPC